jgi:uncharacterized protein YkwD
MKTLRRVIALAAVVVGLLGSASTAQADAGFEDRVLTLVNQERAARGLAPLAASGELQSAARGHADAMATRRFFAHQGPDGSTLTGRVEGAGYRGWTFLAENIAAGQGSPERVMSSWMASPGHRDNLLSPKAREIGVAHVQRDGTEFGHYWVQDFGARPGVVPAAARSVAPSASGCGFTLGFRALRDHIPGLVGGCLENEHHNPENGDGLQRTTGGLLVWRKADNFTAFTNGHRTWVAGPYGVQSRLNSERFFWER